MTRAREEKQLPRAEKIRLATTIQVTAPTFVARLQIYRGEVVVHAPELERWVKGRPAAEALDLMRPGAVWATSVKSFTPPPPRSGSGSPARPASRRV